MPLSPQEQFLLEIAHLSREELARKSNALLDDACHDLSAADRGELCRRILVIDAIAEYKFPGTFAAARRRAA